MNTKLIDIDIPLLQPRNLETKRLRLDELLQMRGDRSDAISELTNEIEGEELELLNRIFMNSDFNDEDDKSFENLTKKQKELEVSEPELVRARNILQKELDKAEEEVSRISRSMDTQMMVHSKIPNQISHPIKLIEGNYYKMDLGSGPFVAMYTGPDGGCRTCDPTLYNELLMFISLEDEGEWCDRVFPDGRDTIGSIDLGSERPSDEEVEKVSLERHMRKQTLPKPTLELLFNNDK